MNHFIGSPEDQHQRIAIVDVLRGWALLSVAVVNYAIFYSYNANIRIPKDDVLSRVLKTIVQIVFESKGWTLLALLFGYGFAVLLSRIKEQGLSPVTFFSRRMFWLLVIGLVNCCLYYGDVLKDYVLVGMIILCFHRAGTKTFLWLSIFCFLVFPALIPWSQNLLLKNPVASPELSLYQSRNLFDVLWFGLKSGVHVFLEVPKLFDWNLVMLACGFMGVYLYKTRFFEEVAYRKQSIKYIFFGAFLFILFISLVHEIDDRNNLGIEQHFKFKMWFLLAQMVFFSAAICWIYVNGKFPRLFFHFRDMGKMTLTNYLGQNLATLLVFSGFGLGLLHRLSYSDHIIIGGILFILQMYFSRWWLARHRYGPVEWIWRSLSTHTFYSNKKTQSI